MANAMYTKGLENILAGSWSWASNIKVALVDSADYTLVIATDNDMADVDIAGAVEATSANLASKTQTDGHADAADFTYSTVTGDVCEYLVVHFDSGTPATSLLICNIDTATGLPVTPNGADIDVVWSSGTDKIFTI